jgi:hypothetical protein
MTAYPSAEELLDGAAADAGHDDFGPGDFRDGLRVLLDDLAGGSDLGQPAATSVVDDLRRRLGNRLEVERWYREHPEIDDLPVRGPVDINGLPRTGTTALANMLSLDPGFRCLRQWEQLRPCPPPQLGAERVDPRRAAAEETIATLPDSLKAMHLFEVDATSEDTEVLGMAFHAQQATLPVFGYQAWWRATDMTAAYAYHRRVLKLLQSRRPPDHWLLKAPHHNFHLEAFVAAYPDARFVMTHRDPAKAVPSWVSIVAAILPEADGERDLQRLGRALAEHLRVGVDQAIAARSRLGDDRFLDVHHHELVSDPMGVVRRVYEFLDLELRRPVEQSIAGWQAANRSGSHGTHRYTAGQFGLSTAQLHDDFDGYIRHFDVAIER